MSQTSAVVAQDIKESLQNSVRQAFASKQALALRGGGSKSFLGNQVPAQPLEIAAHRGVVNYEPDELVITARAGTPLAELKAVLAENGQMLAFEPPGLGEQATLGGTLAAGLSGPRRPYAGSARDFVLGMTIINGRGERLRFGGEVMKNVAGYDLSRLMVGAMGTLGIILDASLKVLPLPRAERSLALDMNQTQALQQMNRYAGQPLPLSAAAWEEGHLFIRLSGATTAVASAARKLGGEAFDGGPYWHDLAELRRPLLARAAVLWRLSLPASSGPLDLPGETLVDWGGAQRWLVSDAGEAKVRQAVRAAGGHATLYRGQAQERFQSPDAALVKLHQTIKQALDPAGILNPGRLLPDL